MAVIESKDLAFNYSFARDIEGADILAHGKVIIESKDPEYNYKFAKDIEGADVQAHKEVLLKCSKKLIEKALNKALVRK